MNSACSRILLATQLGRDVAEQAVGHLRHQVLELALLPHPDDPDGDVQVLLAVEAKAVVEAAVVAVAVKVIATV
eukprot:8275336-Pyramimonas_sp.AAC.1